MILTEKIETSINPNNINYYKKLFNKSFKSKEKIIVDVKDLPKQNGMYESLPSKFINKDIFVYILWDHSNMPDVNMSGFLLIILKSIL